MRYVPYMTAGAVAALLVATLRGEGIALAAVAIAIGMALIVLAIVALATVLAIPDPMREHDTHGDDFPLADNLPLAGDSFAGPPAPAPEALSAGGAAVPALFRIAMAVIAIFRGRDDALRCDEHCPICHGTGRTLDTGRDCPFSMLRL